jgi:hypothetical protein
MEYGERSGGHARSRGPAVLWETPRESGRVGERAVGAAQSLIGASRPPRWPPCSLSVIRSRCASADRGGSEGVALSPPRGPPVAGQGRAAPGSTHARFAV